MNEYSFHIHYRNMPAFEQVIIKCKADDWESPAVEESYINILLAPLVQNYLAHAFTHRGHLFDPERHTPQKLYMALLNNTEWEVSVYGENCELPEDLLAEDELPPGAID